MEALWIAVFGEPPVMRGNPSLLLTLILQSLPSLDYGGFAGTAAPALSSGREAAA